jgi:transglutaminase-like putative cysteine protease
MEFKKSFAKFLGETLCMIIASSYMLGNTPQIYAAEPQFSTEYKTHYDFQTTGEAIVTQSINITNLKSDVIASNYTLSLNQLEVYGVTATVNSKTVTPQKTSENNETVIELNITNYVIGEGRQNKIELIYKTKELASKVGEIWNINIPKTEFSRTTAFYNVQLSIPEKFGPRVYIAPKPTTEDIEEGTASKNHYYFTRDDLINKGISASFGKYQVVNFRLKYQLENPNRLTQIIEIALPPDLAQVQQVKLESLEPWPKKILLDKDGNTIAQYKIKPKQKLEVQVTGKAKITGRQINPGFGGGFTDIPKELTKKYTKSQPYWETEDPRIQEIAKTLKDPKLNVIQNAQLAYEYVVENLDYNYDAVKEETVGRNGAVAASKSSGPWACMEFTDLFIALVRAMGIPAREINGHAFSNLEKDKPLSIQLQGGDYLHAWAEFYDPFYGWTQVDPTWGKTAGIDYFTKLDTNHFAFVVRGIESEYPLSAGTYRFSDGEKLVEVEFPQEENTDNFEEKLLLYKKKNFNLMQLLKKNDKYKLRNEGTIFVYSVNGKVDYLAPQSETKLFLPRGSTKVWYEDIDGMKHERELVVIE